MFVWPRFLSRGVRFWINLQYRWRSFIFTPYVIRKRICGVEFILEIDNLMSQGWYDRDHSWGELEWIRQHMLKPGMIVVDCGAHTGLTSCLFSRWVGESGRVFAFEANPTNYDYLRRNIRANGLNNVTAENAAVSNSDTTVRLHRHPNGAVCSPGTRNSMCVRGVSLDRYFEERRLWPDAIKIDVEGHEEEVLRGASSVLSRGVRMDIEIHSVLYPQDERAEKVARILALLPCEGRQCFIQPVVDGEIVPYRPAIHTPEYIAGLEVAHFFVA
jgi:FkbM family methyltransferase